MVSCLVVFLWILRTGFGLSVLAGNTRPRNNLSCVTLICTRSAEQFIFVCVDNWLHSCMVWRVTFDMTVVFCGRGRYHL